MENHPIPQDVTGFQFKLIGNMTIKQFAYLISGIVFAWVSYISPLPGIIKLPISLLFGFIGFGLAFLPIDGRPMDVMITNFIRALFTPNQYVFAPSEQQQSQPMLKQASILPANVAVPTSSTRIVQETPLPQIAKPPQKDQLEEPKKVEVKPDQQPVQQPQLQTQPVMQQTNPTENYTVLVQELQTARLEKERIEKELLALKQMLTEQKTSQQQVQAPQIQPQPAPAEPTPPPVQVTQPIVKKIAAKGPTKATGLPTPDAPNILIGIVKDSRGNILPNVLVEVKDKDNNPVRAFKTNQLGQFASATPLLNGVYTIEFEDPNAKQKFDALELTMTGEIIAPIEVTSIDAREELRKALFTNN